MCFVKMHLIIAKSWNIFIIMAKIIQFFFEGRFKVFQKTNIEKFYVTKPFLTHSFFFAEFLVEVISTMTFEPSNLFTKVSEVTKTNNFDIYTNSLSMTISLSYVKTFVFTYVQTLSNTFIILYNQEGEIPSYQLTQSYFYIIYSLSPLFVPTYLELDIHKKKMSNENLIGIVCGSVAAFFLIVYIIFLIVRKKKKKNTWSRIHFYDAIQYGL